MYAYLPLLLPSSGLKKGDRQNAFSTQAPTELCDIYHEKVYGGPQGICPSRSPFNFKKAMIRYICLFVYQITPINNVSRISSPHHQFYW